MNSQIKKIWGKLLEIIASLLVPKYYVTSGKKSAVFVIPWLTFGGAEKVNLEILEALQKDNWEVLIVTTKERKNEWEPHFRKYTNKILNIEKLPRKLHTYILLEVVKRYKAQVLFISNSFSGYMATPHLHEYINIVDLVHGEGGVNDDGGAAKFSSTFDQYIDKRIVISDRLKELYINDYKINPNKINVIRNGIDITETINEAEDGVLPTLIKKINTNSKKIVWVGRLSEEKQPLKVIEFAKKMKDYQFIIVGDGELYDDVLKDSMSIPNVILLGKLENKIVKKVISSSDVLIMTSKYEGLPVVILEALALSKPVVSTNVGAIKEIIKDGTNGYLINPENIDQMPEKIAKAYENKRLLMENTVSSLKSGFMKSEMQSKYIEIFNSLINEKS